MGNDFPDSVFASEEAAEKYIAERKELDRAKRATGMWGRQVYWRSYEYEVKQ
jgi:hypothetical protein